MKTREFDVLVLGGGPAGTAAATLLAQRSHRVALVRPTNTPAGALAESIPPSARRLLSELGVLKATDAAGFFRITGTAFGGQATRNGAKILAGTETVTM